MRSAAWITALLLGGAGTAFAVAPKYWIHDSAGELVQGEPDGVSITASGSLTLAPEVTVRSEPDVAYLWDLALDGDTIYLGSGDDGAVLRVRGGETEEFFRGAALEILSVLVDSKGRVWAGTAPEGFLYRIEPDGTGELIHDSESAYVWDLVQGPDGDIYAGVGPGAKVLRIDPESGDAETYLELDDQHVVNLAFDGQGRLLLGTEGKGLVGRVSKRGELSILYDAPQGEVVAVLPGEGDEVWAAAASPAPAREAANEATPDSNGDGSGLDDPMDFSFEFSPPDAGNGVLYHIDADGNATRHWESGQPSIFALAWNGDRSGILVATGDEGYLYSVDLDGEPTLVLDAEAAQLVALARSGERVLMVTDQPAELQELRETEARREGEFRSQVLDARRISRWGRLDWDGDRNGGSVDFAIRTGNTEEPDNTWSEWKQLGRDGEIDREGVRFLQWRAEFSGGEPVVRRVRVSSLENNLRPRVSGVQVTPSGLRFYDDVPELRPRPLYQALPGGVKVQYNFDSGDLEYPPEARAPWTRGMRQVSWDSIDPNGDFLVYDLAYRRVDEREWKEFAEDIEGTNFTFNSQGVPDGRYVIRVKASDRRDNPEDGREAIAESEAFLVDNGAPSFSDLDHERDGDEIRITGRARDELSDVVRIEYSVNGGEWVDRRPVDGIFDSTSEALDVTVEAESGREHTVLFRVTDLAGNLGTARVLVRP